MGTVEVFTAARSQAIEDATIIGGEIVGSNLILARHDGGSVDAGPVVGPTGADGATGPAGADGLSVPAGGAAGDWLQKVSSTDYDYAWSSALRALTLNSRFVTAYTLTTGDEEDMVLIDHTSPCVVTVPLHSVTAFPLGTRIRVAQTNTGLVSIAGSPGVTLRYPVTQTPNLLGRGATVELIKIANDVWILDGHGNLTDVGGGFKTYTPNIVATTSGPNLGTNPVRKGWYIIDKFGRVIGGATVRWDTAGSPTAGNGTYRLTLPVQGVNYEDNGFSPIGNASLGVGLVHTAAMLHFNGGASGSTPTTSSAVAAMHGGLFITDASPAGTRGNLHWHFAYQAAELPTS